MPADGKAQGPVAAAHWQPENGSVRCGLCPHCCLIARGQTGRCGVRRAREHGLVAEAYGRISSLALDPVEKKPLYHFKPGAAILSVGSYGCNLRCSFCQNWTISQQRNFGTEMAPDAVAREALAQEACGVAYTYNEPLINFEYVRDCAQAVRAAGLLNVLVTNGYISPEPCAELLPLVDAWNIDLKSIREDFYERMCGASLAPVQATIRMAAARSHVEITHLVVTGGNDDLGQIAELAAWVASVSPEIPLHLTRYYPQYQWEAPPTPPLLLEQAAELAKTKLTWVYLGNLGPRDDSVYCPQCGETLVDRRGYDTLSMAVKGNACPRCSRRIPGVF
ncbi:MAG: AmmeMemoRadiSam system radical SAM enzyme [candidate division FCPU426 bacterium]